MWRQTAAVGLLASLIVLPSLGAAAAEPGVTTAPLTMTAKPEPDGAAVKLDAEVFRPGGSGRHPAVILAHGFGGDKDDLADQARELADRGYVAVTFSARGFGRSTGRIHLVDPAYEIDDLKRLVSHLAADPGVELDRPGDPRVALVGGSYGGAQALMGAALDRRVDTNIAAITWNDLAAAFYPQAAQNASAPGPFKQLWGSRFFTGVLDDGGSQLCGRFDPTICREFRAAAEAGRPSSQLLKVLHAHSPAPYLKGLKTPSFLVQGEQDSLFGLEHAQATARTLSAQGTPVAVRWSTGGHDGTNPADSPADKQAMYNWLGTHLPSPDSPGAPVRPFEFAVADGPRREVDLPGYPGTTSQRPLPTESLPLRNTRAKVINPPGGEPKSITAIPGANTAGISTYRFAALPQQSVAFDTDRLDRDRVVVGAPQVKLRVTSTADQVTLFTTLWRVDADGPTQPRPLVAPFTAPVKPGTAQDVTVNLPMNAYRMRAGSTWRVLVTATDTGFTSPTQTRVDQVTLADPSLIVPVAPQAVAPAPPLLNTEAKSLLGAIATLLSLIAGYVWWRRARHPHTVREDLADVPLMVEHLVKTYKDGHRAVDDVSWRAERGQVIGLLGPNGAGKTTTIRMLLGLIRPDSGTVHVLGRPIHAGSPVLRHVGALVEGPGFLPHLTGRANLEAYWRATGRPAAEAGFDDALEVAALGDALDRPVRTYSQGMRQRLGIAQAMLGKPDLLFLDEPTNGLDPPQIAAMRPILKAYAATGRTVVVSSHLLGEVEQTCTHVVVMHAGRVITAGPVAELVSSDALTVLVLEPGADLAAAAASLRADPAVREVSVETDPGRLVVDAAMPRAELVRHAVAQGLPLVEVGARKHLEEVFLGVIANAQGAGEEGVSMNDRLRQVRSR